MKIDYMKRTDGHTFVYIENSIYLILFKYIYVKIYLLTRSINQFGSRFSNFIHLKNLLHFYDSKML